MRHFITHVMVCALIWTCLSGRSIGADPTGTRIAVISDADNKDFGALVTAELLDNPSINLVERDDLGKIGDELKLQRLAGSDAVALGKMINADGLLFLDKTSSGTEVRFTAVGLGYALFDEPISAGDNPSQSAKSIAHRVDGYVPKLKLDPAKAIPVSVLNLRADYGTPQTQTLERNLTLLLESQLASVPEYVVLERRHAWSLAFDRSLINAPAPLMHGAYVVDGAFSPVSNTDDITIRLRIRSPNNRDSQTTVSGKTGKLSALVGKIASEIQKQTRTEHSSVSWKPQSEAEEYLREGIWAWQHGTEDEALEALDSAELLGNTSTDLIAARIHVLCKRAGHGMGEPDGGPDKIPLTASFESRAGDVYRAISEIVRYRHALSGSQSPPDSPENEVLLVTSRLLFYMDRNTDPRADDLRLSLRQVSGYDPLHGQLGVASLLPEPYDKSDLYADEWPQSLDEQLAFYHLICAPLGWIPGKLLNKNSEGFCHRFLKTPEEQNSAFDQFVESLKSPPDGRMAYLLFKSRSSDPAEADQAFSSYIDELWNQRDSALGKKYTPLWFFSSGVGQQVLTRNAGKMVPLLRYYLTNWKTSGIESAVLRLLWQPDGWSESEAASVWPDFQLFESHLAQDWKNRGNNLSALPHYLTQYESPFQKKFPQIFLSGQSGPPSSSPLTVKQYWNACLSTEGPQSVGHYRTWDLTPDSIWMYCSFGKKNLFYRIHLPDLKTEIVEPPPGADFQQIKAAPDALYIDYALPKEKVHGLARYDFVAKAWTLHPISLPFYRFYLAGKNIYLDLWRLNPELMTEETGIARYDWNSDQTVLLASSRRKPAQNQFDDLSGRAAITFSHVGNIFAGPNGQPCVTAPQGTYYLQETAGTWLPVFDAAFGGQALTLNDGTLVSTHNGEVVLLSPSQAQPEYLMTPSVPTFRQVATSSQQKPVKSQAAWSDKSYWNAPSGAEFSADGYCSDNIGVHNDLFFVLVAPHQKNGSYELLVYSKKSGREPRHVPLEFHLDPTIRGQLALIYKDDDLKVDDIEHPGGGLFRPDLITTNQGLCFHLFAGGIWFLPYDDLKKYLKALPVTQSNPVPDPTHVNIRSKDITDTNNAGVDPGTPGSFR